MAQSLLELCLMELGIEQNALTMHVLERQQDVIAHNLACNTVAGYQERIPGFVGNKDGIVEFEKLRPFASLTPHLQLKTNEIQGTIEHTQVPTDVALNGKGFFKVQSPDGQKVSFTRNGSFRFNSEGYLCDPQGRLVLGNSGNIQAENNGDPIYIDRTGQVFEGDQQIGSLVAFTLPEGMGLNPGLEYRESDLANVGINEDVVFESGCLEKSNVSSIREMVQMIQVSNAHEANRIAIKQWDNELGEAIETLGNIG